MKQTPIENTRTLAVAGHGGCGKTSIIENLLFKTGANNRLGKVDNNTSMCDYQEDEKRRKITINSKVLSFSYNNFSLFVIDTPGYADFFGDTVGALRATDCTIIVIDVTAGLQVGAMKAWKELEKGNRPRILFINKLDKDQANFEKILASITETFGKNCVPLHLPIGAGANFKGIVNVMNEKGCESVDDTLKEKIKKAKTKLQDTIAETDDSLLEKYLGGETLSPDEIAKGFQKSIAQGAIVPILCGSAEKSIGIDELLEAICTYFPSPSDIGDVSGLPEGETRSPQKDAPFSAFVFKTITDPFIGHLTFFRIYSGTITPNSEVFIPNKDKKERLRHLSIMRGKEQISIDEASAGDIVVVPKLKYATINNTFCIASKKIEYAPMVYPSPALSFSIHPKQKGDEEKIATGLHKLSEDDPTVTIVKNAETKEMVLSGLGDLHIDVILDRLKNKFHVEVEIGKPKIAYKETCRKKAKGHEKHKKQSGGRGQYGEVYLEIAPLKRGSGFEFINKTVGGTIPKGFLPAIEKGIQSTLPDGIVAGYPVVDVSATVYDGSYHDVDSSEIAFKIAGSKAFKEAFLAACPIILEPIMNIEVTVPDDFTGAIMGDLNGKRGRVQGMDAVGHMQAIKAQIPIAEIFTYSNELRSMTGGRGSFSIDFSHYEEVPAHIVQKVIAEAKASKEAEAKV
ncbi:MAG: elongation factor G [Candidatus Omnitrophota bacterium]